MTEAFLNVAPLPFPQSAANEQPQQAGQNETPPRQGASCPNLRVACADGSTFIPKGTDLDALFSNNGPK